MNKIYLKDVSFLIPIRIDCNERLRNLSIILAYLKNHFDTNIYIGEESNNPKLNGLSSEINYFFFKSNSELFHRTRIFNELCKRCDTKIICNHDADCILPVTQYVQTTNLIKSDKYDIIIPYGGLVYNLREEDTELISRASQNEKLLSNIPIQHCKRRRSNSVGGVNFFNKEIYIRGGMMNENLISWGADDDESIHRFRMLFPERFIRLEGVLYHICHPRNINSSMKQPHYKKNVEEMNKVGKLSKEELQNYIKEWSWIK